MGLPGGVFLAAFAALLAALGGPQAVGGQSLSREEAAEMLEEVPVRGVPALSDLQDVEVLGSSSEACGLDLRGLPSGGVAAAHCSGEALIVRLGRVSSTSGTLAVEFADEAVAFDGVTSPVAVATAVLDAGLFVVGLATPDALLVRVAEFGSSPPAFSRWGAAGQLALEVPPSRLQVVPASSGRILATYADAAGAHTHIVRVDPETLGATFLADSSSAWPSVGFPSLLAFPGRSPFAVALAGGGVVGAALAVSEFEVFWQPPVEIPMGGIVAGVLEAVELTSVPGGFFLVTAVGGRLACWCGALGADGVPVGNTSLVPGVAPGAGASSSARVQLLDSEAFLLAYEGEDGALRLRFARCDASGGATAFGAETAAAAAAGAAAPLALAAVSSSSATGAGTGLAVAGSAAGLLVAGDFRCRVLENETHYELSGCSGLGLASRCELACAVTAVPAVPAARCREDGGSFEVNGCVGPSCSLPADPPDRFDVSGCDTSLGPISEAACAIICTSGAEGALVVCSTHLGEFELAGCVERLCLLPDDTTGYDASGCDVSGGPLPAYSCLLGCAVGFEKGVGMQAEALCREDSDRFEFRGCFEQCAAPGGIQFAADPPCEGGSMLVHASSCEARCQPGFSPFPTSLRCNAGVLRPETFECRENSCPAPEGIPDAPWPPCEAGNFVLPNNLCVCMCDEGYSPSVDSLKCSEGAFTPETFACVGLPCVAPSDIPQALPQACMEGEEIAHGSNCTAQCEPGFTADPPTLRCFARELRPVQKFVCGADCVAPEGIAHALAPACEEGSTVRNAASCTPLCEDGFEALVVSEAGREQTDVPRLDCVDGALVPPSYTCAPQRCAAPAGVAHADDPACLEGWSLGHGSSCTAQCLSGFSPSHATLSCQSAVLAPATFRCTAGSCAAPVGVENADPRGACAQGGEVSDGDACAPRCRFGYVSSVGSLRCELGRFWPAVFECVRAAVLTATGVHSAAVANLRTGAQSDKAVVVFQEWGIGLVARAAALESGAMQEEGGARVVEAADEAEVVPGSVVLFSDGDGGCLLAYARRSACGQGAGALVVRRLGVASNGGVEVGQAWDAISVPGSGEGVFGSWLAASSLAVFATAGGEAFTVGASGNPSSTAAFATDQVDAVAIAEVSSNELLVVYSIGGCAQYCLGSIRNDGRIDFAASDDLDDGTQGGATASCWDPGRLAMAALGSKRIMLATTLPLSEGSVRLYSDAATGNRWGGAEPIVPPVTGMGVRPLGPELDDVYCTALDIGSGSATVLAMYRSGGALHVRWAVANQDGLRWSAVLEEIAGVADLPIALAPLRSTAAVVAYGSLAGGGRGRLRVLNDMQCSPPESSPGYDISGCPSGLASQCRARCAEAYVGLARALCPEPDGNFGLHGCVAPCAAPAIHLAMRPACQEGEFVPAGAACTAACLPGHRASTQELRCADDGSGLLTPVFFQCEPLGCAAPSCQEHLGFPTCVEGWFIPHGSSCAPQCEEGYSPTEPFLVCAAAQLEPPGFACVREAEPCRAPEASSVAGAAQATCAEGSLILEGGRCSAQCRDPEFRPEPATLACINSTLHPAAFECVAPCAAPPAVDHVINPPCIEGLLVPHGGNCTLRCDYGYRPEPQNLPCAFGSLRRVSDDLGNTSASPVPSSASPDGGELTDLYACVLTASTCSTPEAVIHLDLGERLANDSRGVYFCEGYGPEIPHAEICVTRCDAELYSGYPQILECNDGRLTPPNFTCGRRCDVSALIGDVRFILQPECVEGEKIGHGEVCHPVCKTGYTSSVQTMHCYNGGFLPSEIECIRLSTGCSAPIGVEQAAPGGACSEGAYVLEGFACTARCVEGYAPSVASLSCQDSELSPPTFQCFEFCPAPPNLEMGWCQEGSEILHGRRCTAECAAGYLPSAPVLECELGVLTPETFECRRYCEATIGSVGTYRDPDALEPGVLELGAPACVEGSVIESGGICTPVCAPGYVPNADRLECVDGSLSPNSFRCDAGKPCNGPAGVENALSRPCEEGDQLEHNSTCTPQCETSYTPSEASLRCWHGSLSPPTFECLGGCVAPHIPFAPRPVCEEGDFIPQGQKCTTRCMPGYSQSFRFLQCSRYGDGLFAPEVYVCGRNCGVPPIENAGDPPCLGGVPVVSGGRCKLNCTHGFAGDAIATCNDGSLQSVRPLKCLLGCPSPEGVANAPEPACAEGQAILHLATCSPLCRSSYVPVSRALLCEDGGLVPGRFRCVRDGNLSLTPAAAQYSADAAVLEARVASLAEGGAVAVLFVAGGKLAVALGRQRGDGAEWLWGTQEVYRTGLSETRSFFPRVVQLDGRTFFTAWRDVDGSAVGRVAFEHSSTLSVAAGCEMHFAAGPLTELEVAAAAAADSSDAAAVVAVAAYVRDDGEGAVQVGRRHGSALLLQWDEEKVFWPSGVARLALTMFDTNLAAVAFQAFEEGADIEHGLVRLFDITAGIGLGPAEVFNPSPVLHTALMALSTPRRLILGFQDARNEEVEMVLQLATVSGLGLELQERLAAGPAPSVVVPLERDGGPLLVVASRSVRWFNVDGHILGLGKVYDLPAVGHAQQGLPAAASRGVGRAVMLLPQDGHAKSLHAAAMQWTCVLPEDVTGYVTDFCDTSKEPLSNSECSLSCREGYVSVGEPRGVCPPPPAEAVFELSGCRQQGCEAPLAVPNAAEPGCEEGWSLEHGELCHAACLEGYTPSLETLACENGQLSPGGFTCIATCCLEALSPQQRQNATERRICDAVQATAASCVAPQGVDDAELPSCAEGGYVLHEATCTPACRAGYVSQAKALVCNNGQLEPATFTCVLAVLLNSDTDAASLESVPFYGVGNISLRILRGHLALATAMEADAFNLAVEAELVRPVQAGVSSFMAALEAGVVATLDLTSEQLVLTHYGVSASLADGQRRLQTQEPRTGPDWQRRRLAEASADLSVGLQMVVDSYIEAERILSACRSLIEGGSALLELEGALTTNWSALLPAGSEVAAALASPASAGWLQAEITEGSRPPVAMELSLDIARDLPDKLGPFLIRLFPELNVTGVASGAGGGDAAEAEKSFLEELLGPFSSLFVAFEAQCKAAFGDLAGAVVFGATLASVPAIVFALLPCLYFTFVIQPKPTLRAGSTAEKQFRAIYMIPKSHRHHWRTGLSWRPRCCLRRRRAECGGCCGAGRGRCRGCCRGRAACVYPGLTVRTQVFCSLCCCPCFRIPETWHVSGAMPYYTGVALFYLVPFCIPCAGAALRGKLRGVFGMPKKPIQDVLAWFCCCFGVAFQEALHVDGAAASYADETRMAEIGDERVREILANEREERRRRRKEKLAQQRSDLALEDMDPDELSLDVARTPSYSDSGSGHGRAGKADVGAGVAGLLDDEDARVMAQFRAEYGDGDEEAPQRPPALHTMAATAGGSSSSSSGSDAEESEGDASPARDAQEEKAAEELERRLHEAQGGDDDSESTSSSGDDSGSVD